jgi:hypothetical protein
VLIPHGTGHRWRSGPDTVAEPLTSLVSRLSYQSEAAFPRALEREWGVSRGSVGRASARA